MKSHFTTVHGACVRAFYSRKIKLRICTYWRNVGSALSECWVSETCITQYAARWPWLGYKIFRWLPLKCTCFIYYGSTVLLQLLKGFRIWTSAKLSCPKHSQLVPTYVSTYVRVRIYLPGPDSKPVHFIRLSAFLARNDQAIKQCNAEMK